MAGMRASLTTGLEAERRSVRCDATLCCPPDARSACAYARSQSRCLFLCAPSSMQKSRLEPAVLSLAPSPICTERDTERKRQGYRVARHAGVEIVKSIGSTCLVAVGPHSCMARPELLSATRR